MKCPKCGYVGQFDVGESRYHPEYQRRRRVCRECGKKYTTYEKIEEEVAPFQERIDPWTHREDEKDNL